MFVYDFPYMPVGSTSYFFNDLILFKDMWFDLLAHVSFYSIIII